MFNVSALQCSALLKFIIHEIILYNRVPYVLFKSMSHSSSIRSGILAYLSMSFFSRPFANLHVSEFLVVKCIEFLCHSCLEIFKDVKYFVPKFSDDCCSHFADKRLFFNLRRHYCCHIMLTKSFIIRCKDDFAFFWMTDNTCFKVIANKLIVVTPSKYSYILT